MDIKNGKDYLTSQDIKAFSIWKFNDVDDLNYPVTSTDDFPEGEFDLRIRTNFFTPKGMEFIGYIVGIRNIYSIAIYIEGQKFRFNRNLPGNYLKTLESIGKALGRKVTISDFSPLKYITDIDLEGFKNIEGEFDLLKKRTDKERLDGL